VIDPKTLTPESLYRLQSETWTQGADFERERIIKLVEETILIHGDQKFFLIKSIKEGLK
jgi:hypothetical protein